MREPLSIASMAFLLASTAWAGSPPSPRPTAAFFKAHRERLLDLLPEKSIVVLRTAPGGEGATTDPYRPGSDFFYVTGFSEPDAVAVLRPNAADGKRYVLFVAPKEFEKEQWTGFRAGLEGAKAEFGADDAFPIGELWTRLPALALGSSSLEYSDGGEAGFLTALLASWNVETPNSKSLREAADLGPLLHKLRVVKDDEEIALIRQAARLSAEGHLLAMSRTRPGVPEYALKAAVVSHCLEGGAARQAYPPIVGSGRNAVILHYDSDDQIMAAGGMVVNDSACEYEMYAADVTRSYPVSGRFTPEQRAIYEIVLEAQKAGFAAARPGTSVAELHATTVNVVVDGLLRLGILAGKKEDIVKDRLFQKFYPHGCCHWLGLDVHDQGSYGYPEGVATSGKARYGKATALLEPGMVTTVEPGIYIPEGSTPDKKWWNIGVRIEDDVLVTKDGSECLSCGAPREIPDVERAILGR